MISTVAALRQCFANWQPASQIPACQHVRFEGEETGDDYYFQVREILCLRGQILSEQNCEAPPPPPHSASTLVSKPLFHKSGESGHNNNNKRKIMGKKE